MICISQCSTTGQHRSLTPTTALPSSCSTVVCEQSYQFRSASSCRPSPRKLVLTLSTDKISNKEVHDRRARDLPILHPGDVVRVMQKGQLVRGEVVAQHASPRSYVVKTEGGSTLRRNRRHLVATKEARPDCRPPPLPSSSVSSRPRSSSPSLRSANTSAPPPDGPPAGLTSAQVKRPVLKTRSGRRVTRPVRFADYVTS